MIGLLSYAPDCEIAATFFVSFEIFLAALFLWMMPFERALLIVFTALRRTPAAVSLSPRWTAASTDFVMLLIFERSTLLRSFLLSACLALFIAERFFFTGAFAAKLFSSLRKYLVFYHKNRF
jgi:hypothetical protein